LIIILSSFTISETTKEEEKWRNVQVLPQTLTSDEMDAVMDAWSESLGVSCDHCHTDGNRASDDKEEKIIARKMLTMTNEINEKYFGKTFRNGKLYDLPQRQSPSVTANCFSPAPARQFHPR
jgi:hypothetical protein